MCTGFGIVVGMSPAAKGGPLVASTTCVLEFIGVAVGKPLIVEGKC